MSTWWSIAARADLVVATNTWDRPFAISNKGWHLLYRFLKASGARSIDLMAEWEPFVPTRIVTQWGQCIANTSVGDWFLVGHYDGHAVVASGIVHARDVDTVSDRCELTPLQGTATYLWLLDIGQELSTAPSGYLISGKPRKGSLMSVSTVKGDKVDLGKAAADQGGTSGLTKLGIRLGWDVRRGDGAEFDLDALVCGLGADGKLISPEWRVFYNQLSSPAGAIVHQGDELTGAKQGDDEVILVDLTKLPADVVDLRVYVTIYEASKRGNQTFAQVENAFVRITDEDTGTELCRYDLTEDAGQHASIEFAKVYFNNGAWAFRAIGNTFDYEIDGVFAAHS